MKPQFKLIERWIVKHGTELLLGAAISGTVLTAASAAKAAVKTDRTIRAMMDSAPTAKEKVGATWRYWVTPALCMTGTIICIAELHHVHVTKETALLAMSTMWQSKYKDLESAVKEVSNEQRTQIESKAVEKELERAAQDGNAPVNGAPELLCYEPYSKQFFRATTQQILWLELTANKIFSESGVLSLNDLIRLIPRGKVVSFGSDFGWRAGENTRNFASGGTKWLGVTTLDSMVDGQKCYVLQYDVSPDHFRLI